MNTKVAKGLIANTQRCCPQSHHIVQHPVHFGYKDGDPITLNHLMAIHLYCDDTEL